jgi:hypothetical protein
LVRSRAYVPYAIDPRRWTPIVAVLVPLAIYLCSAAGHGYWLDSAEFTAAAVGLDIPHPPGHPLFALWSKPFCWLPVGPLPFRVAVSQACAAALALWFVQRALMRSLVTLGLIAPWSRCLLALAGTWTLASAYGFWFQAVRAEVYALQALLVCIAFERISAWTRDRSDARPLLGACLALGLGLANHHFIAVLAMPVLLWPAVDAARMRARTIGMALALGALGSACYLYLPLRAAHEPMMDLGHPVTWRDLWWVVSAQVYARRIGTGALQPLGERFADLLVILAEEFTLVALPLAILGGYALLRVRRTWPLAALWIPAALISLCGRAWLNEVRSNPDVLGYMMPGFFAYVALAMCGVAAVLLRLPTNLAGRRTVSWASAALLLLCSLRFPLGYARASLADFVATDAFDDQRRRALPARSVLILSTPDAVFRHWEGEAVEQLRADVALLPLPFVGYGGSTDVWLRRHPELRGLVHGFLRDGRLGRDALAELAATRPVVLELDSSATLPAYAESTPEGLLYRFGAVPSLARQYVDGRLDLSEPETRKVLLWNHYVEALYYAAHGERARALAAVRRGRALTPEARELVRLEAALREQGPGPLVLTPFLAGRVNAPAP